MNSDKIFIIALYVSLAAHGAVMLMPVAGSFLPVAKTQKIEVEYIKAKPQEKKNFTPVPKQGFVPPQARNEAFLRMPSKITMQQAPPSFVEAASISQNSKKTIAQKPTAPVFSRPTLAKADVIAIKKKITLPPVGQLDADKINNPSYISYYQVVREKIRRSAFQNYSRSDMGEVYLSFIISSDGYLRGVRLVDEKSSPSPYLRETALDSIKQASPFPAFPKVLDYPQLSFNVVISFEVE
ncbi:MAG: TonB family protein [Candidatus Omnitrophica bacterium]|nr:TonB family protein [Candidatus Omnitrophota bacterium]